MIDRSGLLGQSNVLAAWSLRTLSFVKRDRLSFAQFVEGRLAAGLVEEILAAVTSRNEPESLVVHESLDCAGRSSHVVSCQTNEALTFQRPPVIITPTADAIWFFVWPG